MSRASGPPSDTGSESALTNAMTLDDKMTVIMKRSDLDSEQKLELIKTSLNKTDWTHLNARAYNTAKNDKKLNEDLDTANANGGRKGRRDAMCAWILDPTTGKCYQNLTQSLGAEQTWNRREHWQGKNAYVPCKWTNEEFLAMIDSGRIKEREMSSTPGVFEYYDSGDMVIDKKVRKARVLQGRQSEDVLPETDQAENFQRVMDEVNGFNIQALGGGPWERTRSSGVGSGTQLAVGEGAEATPGDDGAAKRRRTQKTPKTPKTAKSAEEVAAQKSEATKKYEAASRRRHQ